TIRNLELLASGSDQGFTLLRTLDNTVSPLGGRLLKRWLIFPLKDMDKINERLDLVAFFVKEVELRNKLTQYIKEAGDVERLVSKIPVKKISPRKVVQIARELRQAGAIKDLCADTTNAYLKKLGELLNPCVPVAERITKEIAAQPPTTEQKG